MQELADDIQEANQTAEKAEVGFYKLKRQLENFLQE